MTRVALALIAMLVCGAASAELYRWVDRDGNIHYTDHPPASAKSVETHKATANVVTSTTPYAVQQAAKNFPVKIYTGTDCGSPCADARELLAKRGVPFAEVSVTQPAQLEELKRVSAGAEVPVTLVGRAVLKGFAADSLHAALDNAGYPSHAGRSVPTDSSAKAADRAPAGEAKGRSAPAADAKAAALAPTKPEASETTEAKGPYTPR